MSWDFEVLVGQNRQFKQEIVMEMMAMNQFKKKATTRLNDVKIYGQLQWWK